MSILSLETLKELDLSNNKITSFPEKIKELKHLEILNLSNNMVEFQDELTEIFETLSARGVIINL